MKRNILIVGLIVILLLLTNQRIKMKQESVILQNSINVLQEENQALSKSNRTLRVYYDKYVDQLSSIEDLESIINSMTEPFTASVKKGIRIPKSECYVLINGEKVTIPPNGLVYVNQEEVSFGAYLYPKDWQFKDQTLSNKLNYTFPHIKNFMLNISYISDHEILKDISLAKGESFLVELSDYGQEVFRINSNFITITYDDPQLSGQDYMPKDFLELEYTGGYENEGFIERYDYSNGYYIYENLQFAGYSYTGRLKNDNGAIVLLEVDSPDYEATKQINATVLPENIKLNKRWMNNDSILEITAVDVLIEVPYGNYKCIEVTTRNDDYSYKKYYAQGLGLVKVEFPNMVESLIDVRIK